MFVHIYCIFPSAVGLLNYVCPHTWLEPTCSEILLVITFLSSLYNTRCKLIGLFFLRFFLCSFSLAEAWSWSWHLSRIFHSYRSTNQVVLLVKRQFLLSFSILNDTSSSLGDFSSFMCFVACITSVRAIGKIWV